ncbi:putative gustatory receptor 28b [Daphnia pulex]|uniref:putative gustatory receptor 28b n=1 Tax=Daphnia pulex TaxID=6669 RepID=UPI001EDCAD67|nr:putative gustatory receptor 28b [Daphnia pulex]
MFSYTAQILLSRWIVLNYRKLRNAVEALQEVERLFGEKFIEQHQCFLGYRFVIAVTLIVTTVVFSFVVMASLFQKFFTADMDLLITVVSYFMLSLVNVMIECTFLLIHMSYYVISHYIQLLFLNSGKSDANGLPMTSRKGVRFLLNEVCRAENLKELRQNALIFDYLCQASSELNDLFSVPVLFILTVKFVTVVSGAFTYIYSFTYSNLILGNVLFVSPFLFVCDWIRLLVIFAAADMPVNQVRILRERLCARSYSRFSKMLAENVAEMTILMQMNEDRIQMSAAGVFKVGVHLIPALVGAVVTYMVILLQN